MKRRTDIPNIPCRCCLGKGVEILPADYIPTLMALRKFPKGSIGSALGLNLAATARANQLVALERWGLAHRIGKAGKDIIWKAGPAPAEF